MRWEVEGRGLAELSCDSSKACQLHGHNSILVYICRSGLPLGLAVCHRDCDDVRACVGALLPSLALHPTARVCCSSDHPAKKS